MSEELLKEIDSLKKELEMAKLDLLRARNDHFRELEYLTEKGELRCTMSATDYTSRTSPRTKIS